MNPQNYHAIHLLPLGGKTRMLCGQFAWNEATGTDYPDVVTCEQCLQAMDSARPDQEEA